MSKNLKKKFKVWSKKSPSMYAFLECFIQFYFLNLPSPFVEQQEMCF